VHGASYGSIDVSKGERRGILTGRVEAVKSFVIILHKFSQISSAATQVRFAWRRFACPRGM
jgi:hypothetical protein